MSSDAAMMNDYTRKDKSVSIKRSRIAPLVIVVLILGSLLTIYVEKSWNYLINTPKYALMCGAPQAPTITHAGIVRYQTNGDLIELYRPGDLWNPSIIIKGFNCMITNMEKANEGKDRPVVGPGDFGQFPIPNNINPHQ